jgi:hypothetical protein
VVRFGFVAKGFLAQEDSVSFTAQLRAEEKFIVTLATLTTRMIDLFFLKMNPYS